MLKKLLKYIEGDDEKSLKRLNYTIYVLVVIVMLFTSAAIYSFKVDSDITKKSDTSVNKSFSIPNSTSINGFPVHATNRYTVFVVTNILNTPTLLTYDPNQFVQQSEYNRGDIVLIKYFNTYGVIVDKSSLTKNSYNILYRDGNRKMETIEIPTEFLLRPSASMISPFIFTP